MRKYRTEIQAVTVLALVLFTIYSLYRGILSSEATTGWTAISSNTRLWGILGLFIIAGAVMSLGGHLGTIASDILITRSNRKKYLEILSIIHEKRRGKYSEVIFKVDKLLCNRKLDKRALVIIENWMETILDTLDEINATDVEKPGVLQYRTPLTTFDPKEFEAYRDDLTSHVIWDALNVILELHDEESQETNKEDYLFDLVRKLQILVHLAEEIIPAIKLPLKETLIEAMHLVCASKTTNFNVFIHSFAEFAKARADNRVIKLDTG